MPSTDLSEQLARPAVDLFVGKLQATRHHHPGYPISRGRLGPAALVGPAGLTPP
jgi:hypothetical protein